MIRFGATLIALMMATAALAADKKVIAIKTRSAEIEVTQPPEVARDAPLAAALLAADRKAAAKWQTEADNEYRSNREYFRDGRRWSTERFYNLQAIVDDRYVSVVRTDSTYTGGAHPNTQFETLLWDRSARKMVSVRPFFVETADGGPAMTTLATLIRRSVAIQKEQRWRESRPPDEKNDPPLPLEERIAADEQLKTAIQPKLLKLGPIALARSTVAGKSAGLRIHLSPYDVDAYAAGPYTVFVPWTEFKQHLSPEGLAVFAGERPEADKDE